MKVLKDKEVVIGLVVLIILSIAAIALIIKREFPQEKKTVQKVVVEETQIKTAQVTEEGAMKAAEAEAQVQEQKMQSEESAKASKEVQAAAADAVAEAEYKVESQEASQNLALAKFEVEQSEFYTSPVYIEYTGEEIEQLEEIYYYWNEYKLDAVDDLIRLPRVRTAFTNELTGTNGFYYYGTLNSDGLPSGSGIAVYENNAYYCGEWKNGKRHGKGMWLQIYPDKPTILNGIAGVTEHSYNGEWQNDLPNGEGQEHISYDLEVMESDEAITNVIGNFKDGYYDSDLYIMLMDENGKTTDWEAVAKKGTFTYYHDRYNAKQKLPVWLKMQDKEEDEYYWISEEENVNWGIFGLKKMN